MANRRRQVDYPAIIGAYKDGAYLRHVYSRMQERADKTNVDGAKSGATLGLRRFVFA